MVQHAGRAAGGSHVITKMSELSAARLPAQSMARPETGRGKELFVPNPNASLTLTVHEEGQVGVNPARLRFTKFRPEKAAMSA